MNGVTPRSTALWKWLLVPLIMLLHIGGSLGGLYLGHHGYLPRLWPSWLPEDWGLAMALVFGLPWLISFAAYFVTMWRSGVSAIVGLFASFVLASLSLLLILFLAVRTWGT